MIKCKGWILAESFECMRKIVINGGKPLKGEVAISGAKNSVVALIPAAILSDDIVILDGVPAISDVDSLIEIMEVMGAKIKREGEMLEIDPRGVKNQTMPYGFNVIIMP